MSELEMSTKVPSVTYSPYTKKIYVGSKPGENFVNDSNLEPIAKINFDKKLGDGRFETINEELYRRAERHIRAGIVDAPSVSTITTTDLLQEVIDRQWRQYFAIQACTIMPVPRLALDVALGTKYSADKEVPELKESELKQEDFTKVSFSLAKHVVHIAVSDEASMKANIEPFQYNIEQASGALAKAWNEDIVTEVETFTVSAKGDWGALNANLDFSSRNPLDDIQDVFTTVANNHRLCNTITMHPRVWSDFISNTFVNGIAPAVERDLIGVIRLPKVPGITAIVDPGFTNTVATLFDKAGMFFGQGPTVAEQYRNAAGGYNGWVIRQWGDPLKATNNFGRKMTSVSA